MRSSTANLPTVLKGSFDKAYQVDVYLDGARVLHNIDVTNVQLNESSTSLVQGSGSLTIIYQGTFADTIAPSKIQDVLSPFGTQIYLYSVVTASAVFKERTLLGVYLVSETPSIRSTKFTFQGTVHNKGDQIDINFKDLMYGVQRDQFNTPGAPPSLASTWAEVQRLTGLPVTRSIADGAISATVAYQQDKLQAVYDLANYSLDATAYMTSDGTVSMRPNTWPAPVDTLSWGDQGTLVDVARGMANDTVYNTVVVRAYGGSQGVLASASLTQGPLRVANTDGSLSPYRRVPYFVSSQYITTVGQAQSYAQRQLPRVSQLRSVSFILTEIFNPLREVGDVLTVNRLGETVTGRVTDISRSSAPTQTTTVAVNQ